MLDGALADCNRVAQELGNGTVVQTNLLNNYQQTPLGLNPLGPGAPPIVHFSYNSGATRGRMIFTS
jgi:hypothetical protein